MHDKAEGLRNEFVIVAIGTVKLRDADTVNQNIPTGEVELVADEIRILNESKLPPFLPSDTALANEETRLKYCYIDLRRECPALVSPSPVFSASFEFASPDPGPGPPVYMPGSPGIP